MRPTNDSAAAPLEGAFKIINSESDISAKDHRCHDERQRYDNNQGDDHHPCGSSSMLAYNTPGPMPLPPQQLFPPPALHGDATAQYRVDGSSGGGDGGSSSGSYAVASSIATMSSAPNLSYESSLFEPCLLHIACDSPPTSASPTTWLTLGANLHEDLYGGAGSGVRLPTPGSEHRADGSYSLDTPRQTTSPPSTTSVTPPQVSGATDSSVSFALDTRGVVLGRGIVPTPNSSCDNAATSRSISNPIAPLLPTDGQCGVASRPENTVTGLGFSQEMGIGCEQWGGQAYELQPDAPLPHIRGHTSTGEPQQQHLHPFRSPQAKSLLLHSHNLSAPDSINSKLFPTASSTLLSSATPAANQISGGGSCGSRSSGSSRSGDNNNNSNNNNNNTHTTLGHEFRTNVASTSSVASGATFSASRRGKGRGGAVGAIFLPSSGGKGKDGVAAVSFSLSSIGKRKASIGKGKATSSKSKAGTSRGHGSGASASVTPLAGSVEHAATTVARSSSYAGGCYGTSDSSTSGGCSIGSRSNNSSSTDENEDDLEDMAEAIAHGIVAQATGRGTALQRGGAKGDVSQPGQSRAIGGRYGNRIGAGGRSGGRGRGRRGRGTGRGRGRGASSVAVGELVFMSIARVQAYENLAVSFSHIGAATA